MKARSSGRCPAFFSLALLFFRSWARWQIFQSPPITISAGLPSGFVRAELSARMSWNSSKKRYFSSNFGEPVSPEGRYREATRISRVVAAIQRPASLKEPKPTSTSASGVRDKMPTPARPFAAASARAKCQPASRAGAKAFSACCGVARTSCMSTISAEVASNQAFMPGLFSLRCLHAARIPLTLTLAMVRVMQPAYRSVYEWRARRFLSHIVAAHTRQPAAARPAPASAGAE